MMNFSRLMFILLPALQNAYSCTHESNQNDVKAYQMSG